MRSTIGLALGLVLAVGISAANVSAEGPRDVHNTSAFWAKADKPIRLHGVRTAVHATRLRSFTLDARAMRSLLVSAPRERTRAAKSRPLVISLPAPDGSFQRFALEASAIMAPGLARRHPEIRTYGGRGITDRSATIHADISPIGFHASVRSARDPWYIDPYYVGRTPSLYASYYGRYAKNTSGTFIEHEVRGTPLTVRRRRSSATFRG